MNNKKILEEYVIYLKVERQYSENTICNYIMDINDFIERIEIDLIHIKVIDVQLYVKYISQNYATSSCNRKISSIRNFYKYLVENNYVMINPVVDIILNKNTSKVPQYLSKEEIFLLLDSINPQTDLEFRDKAMLELLYATGARVSELINIKITDINLEERFINLYGKGNKQRLIPINKNSCEHVFNYLSVTNRLEYFSNSEYLFLNVRNKKLTRQGFYKILKKYGDNIEINNLSPHVFRHSLATHLLDGGANLRIVQEILGHSDISSTQIYTHIAQKKLKKKYNNHHPFGDNKGEI